MAARRDESPGIVADTDVARAVHRAKLELEQMIDLTPQVMLLVDGDRRITRANLAFLRFLEISDFASVLGRSLPEFFSVASPDFFDELFSAGSGYGIRETDATINGIRKGMFRFTVVAIGEESEIHVLIVEDITELKAREAQDEKEHKKDAVKALAGALMHNINQRLTVITVRTRLMNMALDKDEIPTDDLRKGLNDIAGLTMEIAGILDKLDDHQDFVTERYLDGLDILDLEKSKGKAE